MQDMFGCGVVRKMKTAAIKVLHVTCTMYNVTYAFVSVFDTKLHPLPELTKSVVMLGGQCHLEQH
jgi:hypothetical protein